MGAAWLWVAAALAARALVALRTAVPARDADAYLWMAAEAARGDVAALFETVFHPLYPALVALPLAVAPELDPFRAGQLVACGCAALAALPLWRLALRLGNGDRRVAHLTCLTYAIGIWFVRHPADALSEGVFFPLAAWSVERLLAARGRIAPAAVAGLCAGLAYGARPEGAALWLLGAPWLWLRGERRGARAMTAAFALAAAPWPIGWSLAGDGLTLTPKAAFNWEVGAGADGGGIAHYLVQLGRLVGVAFEAIGYLVLPSAVLGAWLGRPRRLADDAALPLLVFALQFFVVPLLRSNVRFLAGYGVLLLPFAGIGLVAIAARLRLRRPVVLAFALGVVFLGDLVRLPQARREDRVIVQDLGAWLGARLGPGETIASDMPRLVWAAGLPPLPPRPIRGPEILATAALTETRFIAVVAERAGLTTGELAAAGFGPVPLPDDLAGRAAERGIVVAGRR